MWCSKTSAFFVINGIIIDSIVSIDGTSHSLNEWIPFDFRYIFILICSCCSCTFQEKKNLKHDGTGYCLIFALFCLLFPRRLILFLIFFCTIFVKIILVELKILCEFQTNSVVEYLRAVAFAVLWVADFSASWLKWAFHCTTVVSMHPYHLLSLFRARSLWSLIWPLILPMIFKLSGAVCCHLQISATKEKHQKTKTLVPV